MVDSLTEAFAFVMKYVDEAGDQPRVTISPVTSFDENGDKVQRFDVSVSGMKVQEGEGRDR